eukprot:1161340-Pelagomonas_calceolata.AAC.4
MRGREEDCKSHLWSASVQSAIVVGSAVREERSRRALIISFKVQKLDHHAYITSDQGLGFCPLSSGHEGGLVQGPQKFSVGTLFLVMLEGELWPYFYRYTCQTEHTHGTPLRLNRNSIRSSNNDSSLDLYLPWTYGASDQPMVKFLYFHARGSHGIRQNTAALTQKSSEVSFSFEWTILETQGQAGSTQKTNNICSSPPGVRASRWRQTPKSPAQKAAFHKFQAHRKAAAAVMLNLLLLDCITCLPSGHQISSAPETAARLNMTSQTGLSSKNRIVFPAWLGSPCKCTCNQAGAGGHLFNHKYFELLDRIYRAHER